jgi:RND family efflux transporter MFP subunit
MKKWMVIGMILVISIAMVGCSKSKESAESKEETFKTVAVMEVQSRLTDDTLEYSGMIQSEIQKNLSFKISGRLDQMFVREGEFVEAGQMLGSIDTQDAKLQLNSINMQMEAAGKEILKVSESLSYSTTQYENSKVLYGSGAISKSALDSVSLGYEQAKLNYAIAQDNRERLSSEKSRLSKMVDDGTIYADQSGFINSIEFELSEFIAPGQPLFTIRSNDQKIVINVTRDDQKMLKIGQPINFIIDDQRKAGNITFIDTVADPQTSTYRVEIAIEEDNVLTGSIVMVEMVIGEIEGIWIPIQSIQSTTIDFVYVIEDGRSSKRSIRVLKVKGDEVLVEGLVTSESLIVSGMKSLVEGMLVKPQE